MTASETDRSHRRKQLLLLAGLLVALGGSVTYSLIRSAKYDVKVERNSAFDLEVTWRCLGCGHTLRDLAGVGPRECPNCHEKEMYVCINHACPRHGAFPVAFQYDAEGVPIEVRVADGSWEPFASEETGVNIRCPKCNAQMFPAPD